MCNNNLIENYVIQQYNGIVEKMSLFKDTNCRNSHFEQGTVINNAGLRKKNETVIIISDKMITQY